MSNSLGWLPSQQEPVESAEPSGHEWSANFVELYNRYFDQLVRVAQRVVQDRSLAEECVQDVFLAYHLKRPLHDASATCAYLRTMTRNAAISKVRAEARHRRPVAPVPTPRASAEDEALGRVSGAALAERISSLPKRQFEVVDCRLQGLSVDATADVLDISSGSVKTHRFRAAAALRAGVGDALAA